MAKLYLSLTINWEGVHINNLNDVQHIRKEIGVTVPVTHFVNPACFIPPWPEIFTRIQSAILPHDEVALELRPLKSLIAEIPGLKFRSEYNFYKTPIRTLQAYLLRQGISPGLLTPFPVSGYGVPPGVYSPAELKLILAHSLQRLQEVFPGKAIRGFRSGAWLANDSLIQALVELGFSYDSSAVPPELLSQGYEPGNTGNFRDGFGSKNGLLTEYLLRLWGHREQSVFFLKNHVFRIAYGNEPIRLHAQPFALGDLTEMPNNGGLTDTTGNINLQRLLQCAQQFIEQQNRNFFLNIGIRQESEIHQKIPLIQFFQDLRQHYPNVQFLTVHDAMNIWKKVVAEDSIQT